MASPLSVWTPFVQIRPLYKWSDANGVTMRVFHHRYHIVRVPKYRHKVLEGKIRERVRDIVRQVSREMGINIVSGVLSRDHVHMFVEIPPHIAVSQFVQRAKGR
jgi:putative transposase